MSGVSMPRRVVTPAPADSPWHGPMRLPVGVRPMVDRVDHGRVLMQIEYDPAVTEADLDAIEEWATLLIARRRRVLRAANQGEAA